MSRRSGSAEQEARSFRIEMRTVVRRPILQRCFVHPIKNPDPQAWRCVACNVSATGIALTLPVRLPEGTVLAIHAWDLPGACPLQARIIQAKQVETFWFTGCELLRRLTDPELRAWCSGPLDWVAEHKQ